MADKKVAINFIESCNLGKLGSDGVALKINFAMDAAKIKEGPHQSAVFGMSRQIARGLADALRTILEDSTPTKTKPTQN